jgi:hypothetical protein
MRVLENRTCFRRKAQRTLRVVRLVHGNKLVPDEILAWRQGSRNGRSPVEGVCDGVAGPFARILCARHEPLLIDLEPYFPGAVPAVAASTRASCHVDQYRGGPVRPLCPVSFDRVACCDGACHACA